MLHLLGTYLISALLTISVSVSGVTGWLFVTTSNYWLTQIIGAALIVFAFIMVTVAFAITQFYSE
jgi:hypothetical protein